MSGFEFITQRLYIREYRSGDINDFLYVIRQPELYPTTYGIPRHYSRLRAKSWFRFIKQNKKAMTAFEFAVFLRDTNRYIGNVGLINISKEHNHADISYYIDKDFRNLGYTTEAAAAMLKFGFETLGFEKISGLCMSQNLASRRVMEKNGMKYEGTLRHDLLKDGVYYDIDHLSILRREYFTNCKVEKE